MKNLSKQAPKTHQPESPYKISGQERKEKKKHLRNLKEFVRVFWFHEDVARVYGDGMNDEEAQKLLTEKYAEITKLNKELNEYKEGHICE